MQKCGPSIRAINIIIKLNNIYEIVAKTKNVKDCHIFSGRVLHEKSYKEQVPSWINVFGMNVASDATWGSQSWLGRLKFT
jgi:hypothetical protein